MKQKKLTQEYIAKRQGSVIKKLARTDAGFGRMIVLGLLEQAKRAVEVTGPTDKVELALTAKIIPISRTSTEPELSSTECLSISINLGIFTLEYEAHSGGLTPDDDDILDEIVIEDAEE